MSNENFNQSIGFTAEELAFITELKPYIGYELKNSHIIELFIENLPKDHFIPDSFYGLKWLKFLHLKKCHFIQIIPRCIHELHEIESLEIESDIRTNLPKGLENFSNLKKITIWIPKLTDIPIELFNLNTIENVSFIGGQFRFLPDLFGNWKNVRKMSISNNDQIEKLSLSIGELFELNYIKISQCPKLTALPPTFGQLSHLRELTLYQTPIAALPASLGGCIALEKMKITGGLEGETAIPASIGNLTALKELEICSDTITALPPEIGKCKALKRLWLVACPRLKEIPASLESLPGLTSFMADRCPRLTPASKAIAQRLEQRSLQ